MKSILNSKRWLSLLLMLVTASVLLLLFHQYHPFWAQNIIHALISTTVLALVLWTAGLAVNSFPTRAGIPAYALIIGLIAGLIAWYADRILLHWWFSDDMHYLSWLKLSNITRLIIAVLLCSSAMMIEAYKKIIGMLDEQLRNISDAAALHREAELFKLRQQLQPHFLYNSLNSISALIMIEPENAQQMIGRLSDFLRTSVKREGREQISIEEELEYIEAYLAIETIRFGNRLQVRYQKEYTDAATIPPFLLQPLLENAIKFGLYGQTGNVTIELHIQLEGDMLIITLRNPFDRYSKPAAGTGFGLQGVQRRLFLLYGRTDLLETKAEENLFTTILKIPQAHV